MSKRSPEESFWGAVLGGLAAIVVILAITSHLGYGPWPTAQQREEAELREHEIFLNGIRHELERAPK